MYNIAVLKSRKRLNKKKRLWVQFAYKHKITFFKNKLSNFLIKDLYKSLNYLLILNKSDNSNVEQKTLLSRKKLLLKKKITIWTNIKRRKFFKKNYLMSFYYF